MNVTSDEIKKIARLSRIAVTDYEVEHMREHVVQVLSYAVRVCDIARDLPEIEVPHINLLCLLRGARLY